MKSSDPNNGEDAKIDALTGTRKLHYKITEDGVDYYQRGLMAVAW